MATAAAPNVMSKETFNASREFLSLTSGQRKWANIFIETSDAHRATREAYGASDDAYVAMLTRKIETSPRIIAALDLFYARTPREKFLRDLENDIRNSTGIARIEARRLYAKVTGLDASSVGELSASPKARVGDIVLVDGKTFTVTAVDANGNPTDGEPL